jgi:hypothetical protein
MWQPIETALKDRTEVLVFIPDWGGYADNPRIVSAYWSDVGWTDNGAAFCGLDGDPTHWMPLPEAPA